MKKDNQVKELEKLISKQKEEIEKLQSLVNTKTIGITWDHSIPEEAAVLLETHKPSLVDQKRTIGKGKNVFINGENLHALEALKKEYSGKVDFIYIDPPYNTGKKDFMYNDSFIDQGDQVRHSKWLTFMKNRLDICRELLSEDGVIFISINDTEQARLKILCDSVFGEKQFITSMPWKSGDGGTNDSKRHFSIVHEYVICYGMPKFSFNLGPKDTSKFMTKLPYENMAQEGKLREGRFQLINLNKQKDYRVSIKLKDGTVLEDYPSMAPQKSIDLWQKSGEIVVNEKHIVYYKSFLEDEKQGKNYKSVLEDLGTAKGAGSRLGKVLGFSLHKMYPKPVDLMKKLLLMASKKDSIVLDFFAGSGTMGQAVMEMNREDGGKRRFILCTNNESNIAEKVAFPRLSNVMNGINFDPALPDQGMTYYKVELKKK